MNIDIINKTNFQEEEFNIFVKNFDIILDIFCKDWDIEKPIINYVPKIWPSFQEIKITVFESNNESAFHGIRKNIPYGMVYSKQDFSKQLSHEIFEILINPHMKKTFEYKNEIFKKEVCDPVTQNTVYVNKSKMSDWVLPSWFELESKGPYNHLNTLKGPFQADLGGYVEKMT